MVALPSAVGEYADSGEILLIDSALHSEAELDGATILSNLSLAQQSDKFIGWLHIQTDRALVLELGGVRSGFFHVRN